MTDATNEDDSWINECNEDDEELADQIATNFNDLEEIHDVFNDIDIN